MITNIKLDTVLKSWYNILKEPKEYLLVIHND